MNASIELANLNRRQKRFNLTLLTEARQNFEDPKGLSSQFRITNMRTTRLRKQTFITSMSKKTLTSFKNIGRKNGGWLISSSNKISSNRVEVVIEQIRTTLHKKQLKQQNNICKILKEIFQIGESINQNLYNYKNLQAKLKFLNNKAKQLKSMTFQFYCFAISGFILYEYQSLSLIIFYFNKALKTLSIKRNIYSFDFRQELQIYKCVSKVFLQAHKLKQARDMAYMYLRKTWRYRNIDEQMNAYDLLGQIQLQDGNIQLSRYFHWRMCHAICQQKQILQISNQQLEKTQKKKLQFCVFQDIMQFVRNQQQIVSILSNHFRSQAQQEAKGFLNSRKNKQIFLYTHRSSNRLLKNHRSIQRKLIDQKQSKQLHFVSSKDIKKIRKLITQFTSFVFELKKHIQTDIFKFQCENQILIKQE